MKAPESDDYPARAGMYRLLKAFPKQGTDYTVALDRAMQEPNLRDIVSNLVGVSVACYVMKCSGDTAAAVKLIDGELRTAEDCVEWLTPD